MAFLHRLLCCLGFASLAVPAWSEDPSSFTVMVYNIENLFDADEVAIYEDYDPKGSNPHPYSPAKVLTKVQHVARNVAQLNGGQGPEIICFQEFEQDFTPGEGPFDYDAFLEKYQDTTVEQMLTSGFNEAIADLPGQALVLKYFEDNGLQGYDVAVAMCPRSDPDTKAHNNVIFTRFDIVAQMIVLTQNARPIQVVTVNAGGSPLILINNHWKSGASSARTEDDRVANATDNRMIVDSILALEPYADVVLVGDLNTYYNAAEYFPTQGWERDTFAIAVLGSQGDELALREPGGPTLYNLWFELPKEERGSEFYHGSWGTLMQMLITPGLYDGHGVGYVDGSFRRLEIQGETVHGPWNLPRDWYFLGESGGGYSDHLPVAADFTSGGTGEPGTFVELENPSREASAPAWVASVDFSETAKVPQPSAEPLKELDDAGLAAHYGEVFEVKARVVKTRPLTIKFGQRDMQVYSYLPEAREALSKKDKGDTLRFVGVLGEHRGEPQFVIHDASWVH